MTPKVLQKVGRLFFTTRGEGTGIGLYQCRHLVEGAGGNLYIASAPGQGTTITSRCAAPQRGRQPALDAGPAM
jgi:signal transduction histidine kinase